MTRRSRTVSLAALFLAALLAPPGVARACVTNAPILVCVDEGYGCSGPVYERRQRFREYQAWRTELGRRRLVADAGVADATRDYAADLAWTLTPLVRAQHADETSCGLDPLERDPAGYLSDEVHRNWLEATFPSAEPRRRRRLVAMGLLPSVSAHNQRCNAEFRASIAGRLRETLSRATLAQVWHEVALRDALSPPDAVERRGALLQFAADSRSGPAAFRTIPWRWYAAYDSWAERQTAESRALQRYFERDGDGQAVIAVVNNAIATLGPQLAEDSAVCPAAAADLAEAIDEARAQIARDIETERASANGQ